MPPNPREHHRELLVAEAARYLKVRERPRNSNRAVEIDYWLTLVGSPLGSPWCAAFAWAMGMQATGRALWPVKMSGRVQDIVDHAGSVGTFTTATPLVRRGDLVVFYYPSLKRYGHIGIVDGVEAGRVLSIDGNTGADALPGTVADRDGWGVFRKSRPISDRVGFIRWAA